MNIQILYFQLRRFLSQQKKDKISSRYIISNILIIKNIEFWKNDGQVV